MANNHTLWKQTYTCEFLALKCAGDVLNIVSPLGSRAEKEISETMAIVKRLRPILLPQPMKLTLVELCAGNALTSVLASHLLPVLKVRAYDIWKRGRHWFRCDRFTYHQADIKAPGFDEQLADADVIIAVHPCRELAVETCRLFIAGPARHLLLMPCCNGDILTATTFHLDPLIADKLTKYEQWCLRLASWLRMTGAEAACERDIKCISPCNIIIHAVKKSGGCNDKKLL